MNSWKVNGFQAKINVLGINIHENNFFSGKFFVLTPASGHFLGGIFTIKVKKKMSSKKSEKNHKNQEKYSKNNGENPSSNRWMVKKLWAKNCPKITLGAQG